MTIPETFRSLLIRGLLLVGVLAAFTLFINLPWFDEPLRPELVELRTPEPVSMDDNAYPLIYGFPAASDRDPLAAGLAIVRELRERYENGQRMTVDEEALHAILGDTGSGDAWRTAFASLPCNSRLSLDCADDLIADAGRADLADPRLGHLIERYERILETSRFEENQEFDAYTPVPAYGELLQIGRIRLAISYRHESAHAFLGRVTRDMEFWRLVLRDGHSLIAKMVALAGLRNDLTFLSTLMRERDLGDEEARAIERIVYPLTQEERDIGETFPSEMRIALLSQKSLAEFFNDTSWLTRLVMQERASLNEYYVTTVVPMQLLASLSADEFYREGGYRRRVYDVRAFPPPLYNLGGKLLLKRLAAEFNVQDYITRVHDLDGRITLVALQAEIEQERAHEVAAVVRASAHRNPYTLAPMDYDPNARTIGFDCLTESPVEVCRVVIGSR